MSRRPGGAAQQLWKVMIGGNTHTILPDNPCWGSPSACSFLDLLKIYKTIMLDQNADFLAINKPPDVRMDGPYACTVLKLLVYLFPPSQFRENEEKLAEWASSVHLHADAAVDDDYVTPRPCHQLDYATSGVLWVARSAESAAKAQRALEGRKVAKDYLAIVHGKLTFDMDIPVLTLQEIRDSLNRTEEMYRKNRKNPNAIDGKLPPHSMLSVYLARDKPPNKRQKRKQTLSKEEWKQVFGEVPSEVKELKPGEQWKTVRKCKVCEAYFEACSTRHGDMLRAKRRKETVESSLPRLFRSDDSLFFHVPLAQSPGEFAMCVQSSNQASVQTGGPDLDYKPSLTQYSILECGKYSGEAVTKVLMHPWTGRRHQLRVHSALLGHPIVGDSTYSCESKSRRMCLHAHRLQVDLGDRKLEYEADDPFRLDTTT